MGEAFGRLFVGAGTNRNAEGRPLLSFRRPHRAENQQTEFAELGRILRKCPEAPAPRRYCAEGMV
jgi:hypothetical protein